jgi:predicted Fe-Mo cluster-binding NifX family protein
MESGKTRGAFLKTTGVDLQKDRGVRKLASLKSERYQRKELQMRIALSTDGGYISAHFGRCPAYTIVDIEEGRIINREEISNPGHQPGFLPQFLSQRGVDCIIAGGMGPRAQALFSQQNIETIIGVQGSIDEVIDKFISRELESGEDLCDHRHGTDHQNELHAHNPHHGQTDFYKQMSSPAAKGKICFSSLGKALSAELDPRFGRARYFLVLDPETLRLEVLENPNREAVQGAGIQTAQMILNRDIGTVVTGRCGPNARKILDSAGITVIEGFSGNIQDIFEKLKNEVKK